MAETANDGWSTESVLAHMQAAAELELWTIPLYLTAWYSIKDPHTGAGKTFGDSIRRVFVEEMLHLELACNVLSAAGGDPVLTGDSAPKYGQAAPHLKWTADAKWKNVDLGSVGHDQLQVFCDVERPDTSGKKFDKPQNTYDSIGDFYDSMACGIERVKGEISWTPERNQARAFNTFGGPRSYLAVDEAIDDDARSTSPDQKALDRFGVILSQGEGSGSIDCGEHDLDLDGLPPHFCVFEALRSSDDYPDVFDLRLPADRVYPDGVEQLVAFSDALYSIMLDQLEAMFNGKQLDARAIPQMWLMITPVMQEVVKTTWSPAATGSDDPAEIAHTCPRWSYLSGVTAMGLQKQFAALPADTQTALAKNGLQLPLVMS